MASAVALWSCWSAIRFAGLPRAGTVQPWDTHLEIGPCLRPETVFPEPWQLAVSFLLKHSADCFRRACLILRGKYEDGKFRLPPWIVGPSNLVSPIILYDAGYDD